MSACPAAFCCPPLPPPPQLSRSHRSSAGITTNKGASWNEKRERRRSRASCLSGVRTSACVYVGSAGDGVAEMAATGRQPPLASFRVFPARAREWCEYTEAKNQAYRYRLVLLVVSVSHKQVGRRDSQTTFGYLSPCLLYLCNLARIKGMRMIRKMRDNDKVAL